MRRCLLHWTIWIQTTHIHPIFRTVHNPAGDVLKFILPAFSKLITTQTLRILIIFKHVIPVEFEYDIDKTYKKKQV